MHATISEVQSDLGGWIRRLGPGEDLIITENERTIARLTAVPIQPKPPRRLGAMSGTVLYMADDFGAPLEDMN